MKSAPREIRPGRQSQPLRGQRGLRRSLSVRCIRNADPERSRQDRDAVFFAFQSQSPRKSAGLRRESQRLSGLRALHRRLPRERDYPNPNWSFMKIEEKPPEKTGGNPCPACVSQLASFSEKHSTPAEAVPDFDRSALSLL